MSVRFAQWKISETTRTDENGTKGSEGNMRIAYIEKIAGAVAAIAILATLQAEASLTLGIGNQAISGYQGPYASVDVTLNDSTTATITFTSLTAGGNIFLLGDGGSVAVNVNATSWTLGSITGANAGTGFTPGPFSNGGAGNEDGFGSFNQSINSDDGFSHSSDMISFVINNTGGTWASADSVLTPNADGYLAGAHIFVAASPANKADGALATGFAADGVVPEPATMIAGVLLLLPFGASTLRVLRRNRPL